MFYGIPNYNQYLKTALAKLTRADVNRVIKRYLSRSGTLVIAAVAKDGEDLKKQLASDAPSPMQYNSPKPDAILEEDKVVQAYPLRLKAENIEVVPVDKVFQ
jgi:zinc protease